MVLAQSQADDLSAQAKALQSNQVDLVDVGSSVATYATVKATPGVSIHKAGGPNWRHIDLGNTGVMSDLKVRQAVMLSIDRIGDAKTLLGPLDWPSTVLDSHIWMNNQSQYKQTCGDFCNQDIAKADSLLESDGFTKGSDGIYAKNGKPINLTFIIPDGVKTSSDEAALQQKSLQDTYDQQMQAYEQSLQGLYGLGKSALGMVNFTGKLF